MENIIKVSIAEAIALFSDPKKVNGGTFVGIDCVTIEKLNKTIKNEDGTFAKGEDGKRLQNPHFGQVKKLNFGSQVMVFQNKNSSSYENMTKKRMAAAGVNPDNFELQPHVWADRITNTPIIEKRSDRTCKYLEVIFMKSGETSFELNGKAIDKKDIIGRKPKSEGLVPIRAYAMESIVSFRLDKQSYIIYK